MSENTNETPGGLQPIPKKLFDALRWAQIILGGLAALYVGLARIWGWPYSAEISGSVAAIVTFIGIFLKVDTAIYFKEV